MHPNDFQDGVALIRTADGIYIWGSPADETEASIWGLRIIVTPVMTEGTALVGAFGTAAEVYEREGARVTFTESGLGDSAGQELFSRNQLRFRGESRLGLAVIRPDHFCTVTGV
jgi:HK97 family phage major capsid protein